MSWIEYGLWDKLKNDSSTGVSLSVTRFNSMEGVDHWQLGASHITVTLHDVTS